MLARFLAPCLLLALAIAGCDVPTASVVCQPAAGVSPDHAGGELIGIGTGVGFRIRDPQLAFRWVAGAEAFTVAVTVDRPSGRFVGAYGIKSPFQHDMRKLDEAIPIGGPRSVLTIPFAPLSAAPRAGKYPLEFWLVNDRYEPSNRLKTEVAVP